MKAALFNEGGWQVPRVHRAGRAFAWGQSKGGESCPRGRVKGVKVLGKAVPVLVIYNSDAFCVLLLQIGY